jgi:hypothetical protein
MNLPSELMGLLSSLADTLSVSLGTQLDQAYPASSTVKESAR